MRPSLTLKQKLLVGSSIVAGMAQRVLFFLNTATWAAAAAYETDLCVFDNRGVVVCRKSARDMQHLFPFADLSALPSFRFPFKEYSYLTKFIYLSINYYKTTFIEYKSLYEVQQAPPLN